MSLSKLVFPSSEDSIFNLINIFYLKNLFSPKNRKQIKSYDWSENYTNTYLRENPFVASLLMIVKTSYFRGDDIVTGYISERFSLGEIFQQSGYLDRGLSMEVSLEEIRPELANFKLNKEEFLRKLDENPTDGWLGMTKYESFNKLSDEDKDKVTDRIIDDCLEFGKNFDDLDFTYDIPIDGVTVVHSEIFENLPVDTQTWKVEEYIKETLN